MRNDQGGELATFRLAARAGVTAYGEKQSSYEKGRAQSPMSLIIEPVRTRKALTEFIRLPRRLYQRMPGYVAPLDVERRELIDPKKSPFFTHGEAAFWIARRDGRAIGRISAQIDSLGEEAIGLFGCFDAVDDPEVVARLLA